MSRKQGGIERVKESALFNTESALIYVVIGVEGSMIGFLAGSIGYFSGVTFLNLHAAIWLFLITWAASVSYLSYQRVPSGALGVGLYFIGIFVLLQPLAVFGPVLAEASSASVPLRSQLLSDGAGNIFTWGLASGVLGAATIFVGRLLSRRADRIQNREMRHQVRKRFED